MILIIKYFNIFLGCVCKSYISAFIFEGKHIRSLNNNAYGIKKLTERKEQNISILSVVLINAVLSKTLIKFAYQELYSEYVFMNSEKG